MFEDDPGREDREYWNNKYDRDQCGEWCFEDSDQHAEGCPFGDEDEDDE